MSNLSSMPVGQYRIDYDLTALVETGTEGGFGVSIAIRAGFENIYSCEIGYALYNEAKEKYGNDDKVNLFLGSSLKRLPDMLKEVEEENVLFWLDAHLSNEKEYFDEDRFPDKERLPLESELHIILENRNCIDDVFLLDDIDLYNDILGLKKIARMFPDHLLEICNNTESDKTLALFPKRD